MIGRKNLGKVRFATSCHVLPLARCCGCTGACANCALEHALQIDQKLLWASIRGYTAEVTQRCAQGAPVNFQDPNGFAPLHLASTRGKTDMVKVLIEHKANLNVVNKSGETPLIMAARQNHMDTVRALVEAKADITIRNKVDKTASEKAKKLGHHAITEYLDQMLRFHQPTRDRKGQLHRVQGRALRAYARDLGGLAGFDDHMLDKFEQLSIGKRS